MKEHENIVEEMEPVTPEEIVTNENELLKALTGKSKPAQETKTIEVSYHGTVFRFRIRALSEREYDSCRERATTYSKNKRFGGMKLPEKTDTVKYHTLLIYKATVDEDRAKLWDNKALWDAVNAVTGTDMVDFLIPLAGKKQQIVDLIEDLSGFNEDAEAAYEGVVKN